MLQEAEQRMWREAADQDVIRRCVALKAPTRFLIAFFGLHRDEIATLRQSLNVRIRGRIPSPATQDQQHIARAWAAAAGARNDVERYLRTAEATELDLRAICSVLMPVEEDFNRDKPREIAGAA